MGPLHPLDSSAPLPKTAAQLRLRFRGVLGQTQSPIPEATDQLWLASFGVLVVRWGWMRLPQRCLSHCTMRAGPPDIRSHSRGDKRSIMVPWDLEGSKRALQTCCVLRDFQWCFLGYDLFQYRCWMVLYVLLRHLILAFLHNFIKCLFPTFFPGFPTVFLLTGLLK